MAFVLNSVAFANGQKIPLRYTGEGENISPPLSWAGAPEATQSYMLVMEDPDAPSGTFRHWVTYDIPATWNELPEGNGSDASNAAIRHVRNDFGHERYDGPSPPRGHGVHHYRFRLVALDTPHIDLPPSADAEKLWRAAQPHIIAEAETVGLYAR